MWDELDVETTLRSPRLSLTPLRKKHAGDLFPVLNDMRLHEFTGGTPLQFEDLTARYAAFERRRSPDGRELWLNWIARRLIDGAVVGHMQATVFGATAILAWVIGLSWQGNGYATEAAREITAWLFLDGNVEEVRAHIHPSHVASERVATHIGLTLSDEVVEGERVWKASKPSS